MSARRTRMTRVLLTCAGGAYGLGVARSLKAASSPYYVIAIDANPYSLHLAEGDERHQARVRAATASAI